MAIGINLGDDKLCDDDWSDHYRDEARVTKKVLETYTEIIWPILLTVIAEPWFKGLPEPVLAAWARLQLANVGVYLTFGPGETGLGVPCTQLVYEIVKQHSRDLTLVEQHKGKA